ncbi:activator of Hsp90 ATPase [Lentinula aff. detonsa]|uniref:Activator of Hsp90 ATPase n=1 Tax=Lentinula aff. detonsa TaxID=2804958 RepID=A0AA38KWB4_9AGAR|nr:activator of Hsp90 ATPase [Lentinula aff. detonsa]KAJ3796823.1 activator of Hsp90 ATPase [Lentinula aff. detonsa]
MALPPSTANWHWKNKNVTQWGRNWLTEELTDLSVKGDKEGEELTITKISEFEGDVELGQRKSKLITIYDCKVNLEWTGKTSDGSEVTGRLDIPEVSHEITLDKSSDYQYFWSITSGSSAAADALVTMAKTRVPPLLEEIFNRLPAALIETHGKDLKVSAEPSRSGTPTPAPSTSASTAAAETSVSSSGAPKPPVKNETKKVSVNSATVTVDASFMAAADDLFNLLTDEKRIPAWTRAAAQSAAKPDTVYSLFGGGVTGKYISLDAPSKIVQTWALQSPTWPSGHIGTLTTTLQQSSDSTKITLSLAGVPLGMEDEIKRNLEGYYIHGLKSIGLGSVL